MTISERIRFLREQLKITQGQLAELAGLHPVSVRKYETNKMHPQPAQISKLADALNISENALTGSALRLETEGDLLGILILLCNSRVLVVNGERCEDGLLKPESIAIQVNPLLDSFFTVSAQKMDGNILLHEITVNLKSPSILPNFRLWEGFSFQYNKAVAAQGDNPTEAEKTLIADFKEKKEKMELILQQSSILLNSSGGISVKLPPQKA